MYSPTDTHLVITAPQLGELLLSARKQRKLTQTDIAHHVGLSQNRISYLEKHPDEISVKQLLSWCAALELDLRLGQRVVPENGPAEW